MNSIVIFSNTIAASGTFLVTLPVPVNISNTELLLTANYGAIAATSGVSMVPTISTDNGVTYHTGNGLSTQVAQAPSVNTFGQGSILVSDAQFAGQITHIRILLTNTDATNAASVNLSAQLYH